MELLKAVRTAAVGWLGSALVFALPVFAAPSSEVAWTADLKRLVDGGDPARGQELESVEPEDVFACQECHGKGGAEADRDKYPLLTGQLAAYTFKQLRDYKTESRRYRKMEQAVAPLSDQQLADLAAWYASRPLPVQEVEEDAAPPDAATLELIFKGDKKRLIAPCAACHGRRGEGAAIDVPALAGQNPKYFVDTMRDYSRGKRGNDIYSRMRLIAAALTREEIQALAAYYGGLSRR